LFLSQVSMALQPQAVSAGETIIQRGAAGAEMYLICRGEVEVLDGQGAMKDVMREGDCFGEVALLLSEPRTATVRARTACDLFVLGRVDFSRILRDHQQFAQAIEQIARERYQKSVSAQQLIS
jgi:CRP-like cAMP-binding protein